MTAPRYVVPTVPSIDDAGVELRAAQFRTRSLKKETKVAGLKLAVAMTDLTTLAGADTDGKVRELCRKAMRPLGSRPDIPSTAAVCVFPPFVALAKKELAGSGVRVAAVSTYFPSGQAELADRLIETRRAVESGADEIDMVIRRGRYLAGHYEETFDEISAVREACGPARLKVILETGELGTLDHVRLASRIAMDAGADFIKTSTGKVNPAATMPVTLVMLEAIRDHYDRTGVRVGMKPAGGIRSAKEALHYLVMLYETLGPAWMTPDLYRFGASSLLNDLLMQLEKERHGRYEAPTHFSTTGAY
jgi:deoxyribose-phosphate aldolase